MGVARSENIDVAIAHIHRSFARHAQLPQRLLHRVGCRFFPDLLAFANGHADGVAKEMLHQSLCRRIKFIAHHRQLLAIGLQRLQHRGDARIRLSVI